MQTRAPTEGDAGGREALRQQQPHRRAGHESSANNDNDDENANRKDIDHEHSYDRDDAADVDDLDDSHPRRPSRSSAVATAVSTSSTISTTNTDDNGNGDGDGDAFTLRSAAAAHAPASSPPPLPFVAPSDLLRPRLPTTGQSVQRDPLMTPLDREQIEGLRAIRAFLKVRTSYDVLPLSYRVIVFDTSLLVKKSVNIMSQCGIVSAPLWDSKTSKFAGLLTTSDYINVVQYYWLKPDALQQVDKFRLDSLREIERAIGVSPIETVSIEPDKSLYDACRRMLASRARRIPLIDVDDETQREMVVSVITQYRILKFITVNVKETQQLPKQLRDLKLGTYTNLATATMDTPVMDCIHMLVKKSISSVPILDSDGTVLNVFEAVDVITLIKGGDYETNLNLSVGKALEKRSDDFPGIYTCTLNDRLDTVFDTIRKSRVHRLIIIDEAKQLKGTLSLSDILDYTLNSPLGDEDEP